MRLLSISYLSGAERKYAILLELGRRSDKICGLYSHLLPSPDVDKIMKVVPILEEYSLEDRLRWVREHITGFNEAYREITISKVEVEDTFEIGKSNK